MAPLALLLLAIACDSGDPSPPVGSRAFRMGFSNFPPKLDQAVAVQALQAWATRADIAIVHEELPWTGLLAGTPPDTILAHEKDDLIGFYRSRNLRLVFVADADDGLSRDREAPELRALGRSIAEPVVQAAYRAYIMAFVRRYHPEYVGLAAETNLIRYAAPAALYHGVVQVANAAHADLASLPDPPKIFVSVQVEVAWGKLIGQSYQGVEQDFQDFPGLDLLGLSSYPYFAWVDPNDVPAEYYSRILNGRSLPVMVVEGGWASENAGTYVTSPAKQARYLAKQARLLGAVSALGMIQLTPTDIDLTAFPADLRESVRPFATLGVFDVTLTPKPALQVWDSLFALPRR
jgi:hypothetical protein